MFMRRQRIRWVRADDNRAAREAFADVIVGVAEQFDTDTAREECTERLARRTAQAEGDEVGGDVADGAAFLGSLPPCGGG